jgi:phosphoglucosamine mutase
MGEFFGTDGIRGIAGKFPLDPSTVERIGYSLARQLAARFGRAPVLVIGRDTRESGEWLGDAVVRGITTAGGEAHSAGIITTPGVAYLTRYCHADAGIVISASHNPYADNGIKIFAPSGQKIDDAAETAIEADLRAAESAFPAMTGISITTEPELQEQYLAFLSKEVAAGLSLDGMKIALDCANGAAFEIAPVLFTSLGAQVTAINVEPDGQNINRDCGSLHPEQLQRVVVAAGTDMGIAFDGDADRVLLVDEKGRLVDGDQILFIMAGYLAARDRLAGRRVVATVMSNLGLETALRAREIVLDRTQVGDKYVLDELLRNGASIGGEQSGHIIFPKISLAGDGLITALEVLRAVIASQRSLSDLLSGFKRFPQVIVNVRVARKPPLETVPRIKAGMAGLGEKLGTRGRLLVRYSGTENLVRVMIEGEDEATISRDAQDLATILKEELS